MSDKTLVIPGTQASNLDDQSGTQVWNAVSVNVGLSKKSLGGRPPSQWRPLLSMTHTPGTFAPAQTSQSPTTELSATSIVHSPYDRLMAMCDDEFPYDWRGDIRYNAELLIEHLQENLPKKGRWNLIGHSQGCLIIVAASKLMATPAAFAELVARVILVAGPLAGTMRAAEALLFGRHDLGDDATQDVRAASRTWPALYQMLPSWSAILGPDDHPLPPSQQLLQPGGWVDDGLPPGVLEDMCTRAKETQALFEGPFSYMGPRVGKLVILGKEQVTPITVLRNGDTMDQEHETLELGDTLVPYAHTMSWGGKPYGNWVVAIVGGADHSMLCEEKETLDLIKRKLKQTQS